MGPIFEGRICALTVSSKDQDLRNQELQLRAAAERVELEIIEIYKDNGISTPRVWALPSL
jgi:hypothetical protein